MLKDLQVRKLGKASVWSLNFSVLIIGYEHFGLYYQSLAVPGDPGELSRWFWVSHFAEKTRFLGSSKSIEEYTILLPIQIGPGEEYEAQWLISLESSFSGVSTDVQQSWGK